MDLWIPAFMPIADLGLVWLPDPATLPEVSVPGFWGILMQNNPEVP